MSYIRLLSYSATAEALAAPRHWRVCLLKTSRRGSGIFYHGVHVDTYCRALMLAPRVGVATLLFLSVGHWGPTAVFSLLSRVPGMFLEEIRRGNVETPSVLPWC